MGYDGNGFRVVFSPKNPDSTLIQVAVILRAEDAEDAAEKARMAMEMTKEEWRLFKVTPEHLQ